MQPGTYEILQRATEHRLAVVSFAGCNPVLHGLCDWNSYVTVVWFARLHDVKFVDVFLYLF